MIQWTGKGFPPSAPTDDWGKSLCFKDTDTQQHITPTREPHQRSPQLAGFGKQYLQAPSMQNIGAVCKKKTMFHGIAFWLLENIQHSSLKFTPNFLLSRHYALISDLDHPGFQEMKHFYQSHGQFMLLLSTFKQVPITHSTDSSLKSFWFPVGFPSWILK